MSEELSEMSRRVLLQNAAMVAMASVLPTVAAADEAADTAVQNVMQVSPAGAPRPNILYIHSHDSGRFLSPYGHSVTTPNLMKLAREGVLFRQAFSGAPTCSPSRACLLTGQSAHEAGMMGLVNRGFKMPDYSHHLCHTLRAAGYLSVLAGLQHIAPNPEMIGFDELLKHRSPRAADVVPGAAKFLLDKPEQPFFLDCGFFETHRSYSKGKTFGYLDETPLDDPNYVKVPFNLPDVEDTRKDIAGFNAEARVLDWAVGTIVDALAKAGLAENTIVISTTDHGIAFPHMKCNLNDNGWGVSMIVRGPAPFRGGSVCDALVSQLDIYPTLCEFLGIAIPSWCNGKSLLPVLRGEVKQVNEAVFAEVNYHAAYEPKRAVRTSRFKYIKRYDGRTTVVLDNCDNGLSKKYLEENDWKNQKFEADEKLFDLIFDPAEHTNLAANPAYSEALADMRRRLADWQKKTNDPILKGPIPLPDGARRSDSKSDEHEHD